MNFILSTQCLNVYIHWYNYLFYIILYTNSIFMRFGKILKIYEISVVQVSQVPPPGGATGRFVPPWTPAI